MPKTLGQGNLHYRAPLTLVVGFYNSGPNPCKLRHEGVTIVTVVLSHGTQLALSCVWARRLSPLKSNYKGLRVHDSAGSLDPVSWACLLQKTGKVAMRVSCLILIGFPG